MLGMCEESVPGEADETRERGRDREEPRHVKGGSSLTPWGGDSGLHPPSWRRGSWAVTSKPHQSLPEHALPGTETLGTLISLHCGLGGLGSLRKKASMGSHR